MTRKKELRRASTGSCRGSVLLVGVVVGLTIGYVWKKVEMSSLARRAEAAQAHLVQLDQDRSKLTAAIVFRKKPGAIEELAVGRLGMVYPAGQLDELSFENRGGEVD